MLRFAKELRANLASTWYNINKEGGTVLLLKDRRGHHE